MLVQTEDGAFWLSFLRSLVARGLSGVQLVTSDAHLGLKDAIASVFAGSSWQRCRTHFMVNLLSRAGACGRPRGYPSCGWPWCLLLGVWLEFNTTMTRGWIDSPRT